MSRKKGKHQVCIRTFWKKNLNWPDGREPQIGRRIALHYVDTVEVARDVVGLDVGDTMMFVDERPGQTGPAVGSAEYAVRRHETGVRHRERHGGGRVRDLSAGQCARRSGLLD